MKFKRIIFDSTTERDLYYLFLPSFEDVKLIKSLPKKYFVLLILNQLKSFSKISVFYLANEFYKKGMVYLCSWGNDCEIIHDLFDEEICSIFQDETDDNVIMTTWHKDETLDEALWFSINTAWPANDYFDECKRVLVLNVGGKNLETHILDQLKNPKKLTKDACKEIQ